MKRFITKKLLNWKESKFRKPLVIRGARQVGKTYTITNFGKKYYNSFFLFDFEKDINLHKIFAGDLSPEKIIMQLELYAGERILPDNSLLFFDEIQSCPRAILSLRYFYEQAPEFHIISAGSLLEFAMGDVSFPIGRITFEWMRPLSFAEFLNALDLGILTEKLPTLEYKKELTEYIHTKIMDNLRLYFIIGGMPEAILMYIETKSLTETSSVHKTLCQSYIQSLLKYNRKADLEVMEKIFERIPSQIGFQIKFMNLDRDRRVEKIKSAYQILERSLIIQSIHSSVAQGLPLGATVSYKIFKALFLDIGIMQHLCGFDPVLIVQEKKLMSLYKGSLAEQFVGQELLTCGIASENNKLYYWSRSKKNSSAEVDYLIARNGNIYPVEVKSGPAGKLKSMHLFLKEHPDSPYGIVLSSNIYNKNKIGNLIFLPLYTNLSS